MFSIRSGGYMSLGYFNSPKDKGDGGKRYRALIIVQGWMKGKGHLPKDLITALYFLIPGLKPKDQDDWEYDKDPDSN